MGESATGLVLGGGGFFGAFQAGVYEKLAAFDCVVGASAGALNGWAIAAGMPPEELQRLWLHVASEPRPGPHFPRYWGDGFVDTRGLEEMVRTLVRNWRPKVELGIVVSQGWSCRQVLLRGREVTADTLLASCAVPFLLPGKHLSGRLSLDGGLRDACPLWAARAMGAQTITGVNVWTHLPWWWPRLGRVRTNGDEPITMIEPPERLGPIRRSATANREDVERWIGMGREAAAAVFARQ